MRLPNPARALRARRNRRVNPLEAPYLALLERLLLEGERVRSGAVLRSTGAPEPTVRLLNQNLAFDLTRGFPAVTTKELWWRGVVCEFLWFLRGEPRLDWLRAQKASQTWEPWADADGYLGPLYPAQLRRKPGQRHRSADWEPRPAFEHRHWYEPTFVDQVARAAADLRAVVANPDDRARRRILISYWDPANTDAMALPPCHVSSQLHVEPDPGSGRPAGLSGHLYMRSSDAFAGLPWNVAQYALFLHLFALAAGLEPRTLHATLSDCHLYLNQRDAAAEQVRRRPLPPPRLYVHPRARLVARAGLGLADCRTLEPGQFELQGYRHHPKLTREIAV